MYKVGMYGGSFNPLHIGHINTIVEASCICEKLYVILSYSLNREEIDYKVRLKWLKDVLKDFENVKILLVEDQASNKSSYNWEEGAEKVKNLIKDKIDIVFCGDDYKDINIFEQLYKETVIQYVSRKNINISSTFIRNNQFKYFEFLPDSVKRYYTKKVVIVGTESCGKSTLTRNLALLYNTNYVDEVGRRVCDKAGGLNKMVPDDFVKILKVHKQVENNKLKYSNKVIFIDTEATVTLYYYKLLFNIDHDAIWELGNKIIKKNDYDLYLYLEPDVKWVKDGSRIYGDIEVRKVNNKMLKKMFDERGINYFSISGNYTERLTKAKQLINNLLGDNSL